VKKERIDKLLHETGFADSLNIAQALVMSGVVLADEKRVEKPSETFSPDIEIRIKGETAASRYVGRGGLKLENALLEFHICPSGYLCLDIGSSTGGFTDCLLQNGARKVVAVDVGTNQLVWGLRNDDRVEVRENTNARHLMPEDFKEKFDLIVIDVSFISLTRIIPRAMPLLAVNGRIIPLIKPQFEVAKGEVGDGGIVRETEKHDRVVSELNAFAVSLGLRVSGIIESPIRGAEGNKEFLALYER